MASNTDTLAMGADGKSDYISELGFEVVDHVQPNGIVVHTIRDELSSREATMTERVLWQAMVTARQHKAALLDALQQVVEVMDTALMVGMPGIPDNADGPRAVARDAMALATGAAA